jgi:hypothetical protein
MAERFIVCAGQFTPYAPRHNDRMTWAVFERWLTNVGRIPRRKIHESPHRGRLCMRLIPECNRPMS